MQDNISICTYSTAALTALERDHTTWKLVWECIQTLNKLRDIRTFTLVWVPGHAGVQGNEKAGELAERGSRELLIGSEPTLGIQSKTIKDVV